MTTSLGLDWQSVLIRREAQAHLIEWETGCLKNKSQALSFYRGESRECSLEVYIDNQSKIVIVFRERERERERDYCYLSGL